MKNNIKLLLVTGIILVWSIPAYSWNAKTHEAITVKAELVMLGI